MKYLFFFIAVLSFSSTVWSQEIYRMTNGNFYSPLDIKKETEIIKQIAFDLNGDGKAQKEEYVQDINGDGKITAKEEFEFAILYTNQKAKIKYIENSLKKQKSFIGNLLKEEYLPEIKTRKLLIEEAEKEKRILNQKYYLENKVEKLNIYKRKIIDAVESRDENIYKKYSRLFIKELGLPKETKINNNIFINYLEKPEIGVSNDYTKSENRYSIIISSGMGEEPFFEFKIQGKIIKGDICIQGKKTFICLDKSKWLKAIDGKKHLFGSIVLNKKGKIYAGGLRDIILNFGRKKIKAVWAIGVYKNKKWYYSGIKLHNINAKLLAADGREYNFSTHSGTLPTITKNSKGKVTYGYLEGEKIGFKNGKILKNVRGCITFIKGERKLFSISSIKDTGYGLSDEIPYKTIIGDTRKFHTVEMFDDYGRVIRASSNHKKGYYDARYILNNKKYIRNINDKRLLAADNKKYLFDNDFGNREEILFDENDKVINGEITDSQIEIFGTKVKVQSCRYKYINGKSIFSNIVLGEEQAFRTITGSQYNFSQASRLKFNSNGEIEEAFLYKTTIKLFGKEVRINSCEMNFKNDKISYSSIDLAEETTLMTANGHEYKFHYNKNDGNNIVLDQKERVVYAREFNKTIKIHQKDIKIKELEVNFLNGKIKYSNILLEDERILKADDNKEYPFRYLYKLSVKGLVEEGYGESFEYLNGRYIKDEPNNQISENTKSFNLKKEGIFINLYKKKVKAASCYEYKFQTEDGRVQLLYNGVILTKPEKLYAANGKIYTFAPVRFPSLIYDGGIELDPENKVTKGMIINSAIKVDGKIIKVKSCDFEYVYGVEKFTNLKD